MGDIANKLLSWYDRNKRLLPWRDVQDPYKTWVSEIMLQQTRVETVHGYYQRFLQQIPTVEALANAPEEQLLKTWEGLGYYSRVRNMQKAARQIMADFGGEMPHDADRLGTLCGIGPYTAGAIASIAFHQRVPAIDGNAIRVFARLYNMEDDTALPSTQKKLYACAMAQLDEHRPGDFNQALMDLGAGICTPGTPDCERCPLSACCEAFQEGEPESLPVRTRQVKPKVLSYGVALVFCGDEVLVRKRPETLLHGLFTFYMAEDCQTQQSLAGALQKEKLRITFAGDAGHSRHVFTHRVWEMENLLFTAENKADVPNCQWVSSASLDELPIPTAMKAAKKAAQAYAKKSEG